MHGSFENTHTRFILCFPHAKNYGGRFIQHLEGGLGGNEYTGYVAGGLYLARRNNAYYVESNQGHSGDLRVLRDHASVFDWEASAKTAQYGREFAKKIYGEEPHHGYLYGGSGGGYRCVKCAEAPIKVWDAFMPMIMSYPSFFTFYDSIMALTVQILGDKIKDVVDATDPGGNGNPFAILENNLQKEALASLYQSGFPRGAEAQLRPNPFWPYAMQILPDPKHYETFWEEPGFEGKDDDHVVRSLLIEEDVEVEELLKVNQIRSLIVVNDLDDGMLRDLIFPKEANIGMKVKCINPGKYVGCTIQLPNGRKMYCTHNADDVLVALFSRHSLDDVEKGDIVHLDNRRLVAFSFHHRHFVSNRYPEMKQFFIDGIPIYKPSSRSLDHIPIPSGKFHGKMIIVQNAQDCDACPSNARAYIESVKNHLGNSLDNYFRIYWTENACHLQPLTSVESTRYIPWGSIVSQAMNDLIKWIEEGTSPPTSTNYNFNIHSALQLPGNASERKGIQPTVKLSINGKKNAHINVDHTILLDGEAEAPPNTGYFIKLDWDFDGSGKFSHQEELGGNESKIKTTASHQYSKPGTYFVTFRVFMERNGEKRDVIHHIINQSRVRVIVS
ncbi:MAG: PKD domain-containing protein [Candidatus Lokiarchaeota archaeon]|nr:PKD domain-containing protein [Candidatus Lokiarchaeota archaeon]